MSSRVATVIVVGGLLIVSLVLVFIVQSLIAPRLLAGTLSEPVPQTCNLGGKQWVLYDCLPNPFTGFGCIIPGSKGEFLTYKTVAVQVSPCLPQGFTGSQNTGERIVTWQWQPQGEAGPCVSSGDTCCKYSSSCYSQESYLCVKTGAGDGGEDQCVPSFLPVPQPNFDRFHPDPSKVALVVQVPCRANYCSSTVP